MKCYVRPTAVTFATLLLAVRGVDALSVQSSDVVTSSVGGALSLEKTWTVSSAEQLRKLLVHVPGNVFVDYDATLKSSSSGVVAKIVVNSDSKDLIDVFEVIPQRSKHRQVSEDSFKLHLKNEDAAVKGNVLTQIFVSDLKTLHDISAVSAQEFVVGANVVTDNDAAAKVKLTSAGSGGFYFSSREQFTVGSLKISTAGSGDVQFQVPSLHVANDLKLSIAGNGDVAVVAGDIEAKDLKSSTAGDGDAFVQSDSLKVSNLESSVAGSGSVTLSKNGSCVKQEISVMGSGSVATGSIHVQTLTIFSHGDIVKPATSNDFETYKVVEIPARAPVHVDLTLREQYYAEDPQVHAVVATDDGIFTSMANFTFAPFSPTTGSGPSVWPILGGAGIACAAIGALIRKYRKQSNNEECVTIKTSPQQHTHLKMKCFMQSTIAALVTLLLATSGADALFVETSDITPSSVGGLQSLEKTWTVSSAKQLQALFVQVPGNVFVDYDATLKASSTASDVVAKVVVSGDSKKLIDVFDVSPRYKSKGKLSESSFNLHLKNKNATMAGNVLTQIFVSDLKMLRHISAAMSTSFVVGENVLTSDDSTAKIKLATAGSGTFYVTSAEKFALQSLKISNAGSGDVQFQIPSLQVSKVVELSTTGSGVIAVVANDIQANTLKSYSAGRADTFVQAKTLTVSTLKSSVEGAGSVNLSKNGSCQRQHISIIGSGSVATGSIVCQETLVSVVGEGDVTLQSVEYLKVASMHAGSVKYVNARPKQVKSSAYHLHVDPVQPAMSNDFETYKVVEIPARVPVHLELKLQEEPFLYNPDVEVIDKPAVENLTAAMNFAATSISPGSSSVFPVVGVVGVALAAVGAAVIKQRKNRKEYEPLV
uniref:Putative auto-transporter adhesin head GIN domain-containing protein n=1 Tax=Globisporangium ultimum (strain ATCC 200006 / CBS 805.95 / DAOM BR144) TaxID=431595 RepID=K3X9H3_GLOUD